MQSEGWTTRRCSWMSCCSTSPSREFLLLKVIRSDSNKLTPEDTISCLDGAEETNGRQRVAWQSAGFIPAAVIPLRWRLKRRWLKAWQISADRSTSTWTPFSSPRCRQRRPRISELTGNGPRRRGQSRHFAAKIPNATAPVVSWKGRRGSCLTWLQRAPGDILGIFLMQISRGDFCCHILLEISNTISKKPAAPDILLTIHHVTASLFVSQQVGGEGKMSEMSTSSTPPRICSTKGRKLFLTRSSVQKGQNLRYLTL